MAEIKQNADGSMAIVSEQSGLEILRLGGPVTPTAATGRTSRAENTDKVILGVASSSSALTQTLVQWQPPNPAEDVIVTRVCVNIQTTCQANMDVGVSISNSITSSNIISALSLSAPGLADNITDKGSNGKSRQYVTAGSFVQATPSGTTVGLVGAMYITYIKA